MEMTTNEFLDMLEHGTLPTANGDEPVPAAAPQTTAHPEEEFFRRKGS
jgi:hypothetical protein